MLGSRYGNIMVYDKDYCFSWRSTNQIAFFQYLSHLWVLTFRRKQCCIHNISYFCVTCAVGYLCTEIGKWKPCTNTLDFNFYSASTSEFQNTYFSTRLISTWKIVIPGYKYCLTINVSKFNTLACYELQENIEYDSTNR